MNNKLYLRKGFFVFLLLAFFSCQNNHKKGDDVKNGEDGQLQLESSNQMDSIVNDYKREADSINIQREHLAKMKMMSRENEVSFGKKINMAGDTLDIYFSHISSSDSVNVSSDYYFDKKEFQTLDYYSQIYIKRDHSSLDTIYIEKQNFDTNNILTEELLTKGVLFYSKFKGVNDEFKIRINYSITIPATDIGIGVYILIDSVNNVSYHEL